MCKDKGRKWDGKSRVSNDKYRKRFDEITWRNMDEIAAEISKDANAWIKCYKKWKKQGIINDEVKVKDLKKIFGQKEQEELNESYQQSLNNKNARQNKK